MIAYYSEIDPIAAATIREAIKAGMIAPGIVDERDIRDIRPDELAGFTQVHLFAGGGLWSYAKRRAGWPDDRPAWSCSCPCQPFSTAGSGGGFDDERHLWPAAQWLIAQCRPVIVFGEQVGDKRADPWVDLVQSDVEALGYAFGCVPLASAGFGAPNIRNRNYWVAYAAGSGREGLGGRRQVGAPEYRNAGRMEYANGDGRSAGRIGGPAARLGMPALAASDLSGLGHADRQSERRGFGEEASSQICRKGEVGFDDGQRLRAISGGTGPADRMADPQNLGHQRGGIARGRGHGPSDSSDAFGLANTLRAGRAKRRSWAGSGSPAGSGGASDGDQGAVNGFWRDADWLLCRDPGGPRWRPVDAGTFPLAPGHPARVGGLRISGNAINPEVATGFVEAVIAHLRTSESVAA